MKLRGMFISVCALAFSTLITKSTQAETITYSQNFFNVISEIESFNQSDVGSLVVIGSASLDQLSQFDASLGTLIGATITLETYFAANTGDLYGDQPIDFDLPSSATVELAAGYGLTFDTTDREHSLGSTLPFSDSISCFRGGMDLVPCFGTFGDSQVFQFVETYTLGGVDLVSLVGDGVIDNVSVQLFLGITGMELNNLENASLDFYSFIFADITVEYEYAPIPVPAAAWLFFSALCSIGLIQTSLKHSGVGPFDFLASN